MISAGVSLEMSKVRAAMADLCSAQGVRFEGGTGREGRQFIIKQSAMLAETLVNVTPPSNRQQTSQKIEEGITRKFHVYGTEGRDYMPPEDSKHGTGNVRWYAWGSDYLSGVAKDADMTRASEEDLRQLMYARTPRGMIMAGSHGKQRIRIWQKITVRATTLRRLIRRIQSHVGRLKAGWLPAYDRLRAMGGLSASSRPPGPFVTRHRAGARGDFQNELAMQNAPSLTLINSAVGIGKASEPLIAALRIRGKAMAKDMMLYLKGIKQKHGMN